jgi:hypothetical protein
MGVKMFNFLFKNTATIGAKSFLTNPYVLIISAISIMGLGVLYHKGMLHISNKGIDIWSSNNKGSVVENNGHIDTKGSINGTATNSNDYGSARVANNGSMRADADVNLTSTVGNAASNRIIDIKPD